MSIEVTMTDKEAAEKWACDVLRLFDADKSNSPHRFKMLVEMFDQVSIQVRAKTEKRILDTLNKSDDKDNWNAADWLETKLAKETKWVHQKS